MRKTIALALTFCSFNLFAKSFIERAFELDTYDEFVRCSMSNLEGTMQLELYYDDDFKLVGMATLEGFHVYFDSTEFKKDEKAWKDYQKSIKNKKKSYKLVLKDKDGATDLSLKLEACPADRLDCMASGKVEISNILAKRAGEYDIFCRSKD